MLFRQLFDHESSTYTYLIADSKSKEGLLIDPVLEQVDRDLRLLQELEIDLKYIFETHLHADHVTASGELREHAGGKVGISENAGVECADILLCEGQSHSIGSLAVEVIATPGHTNACLSFVIGDRVFTGDALLIRGCGRTDFQNGSSKTLFLSVREKLFKLPDETLIFPGHDYLGRCCSSIEEEKKFNPRLKEAVQLQEFERIMANLNLPQPQLMDIALPANKTCGEVSK